MTDLGARLPAVARRYGWTAERLTDTLLTDATLRVDPTDHLFYVEPAIGPAPTSAMSAAAAPGASQAAAPFPLSGTFMLHSLPGARLTILLDFGPRTMSGNRWAKDYNGGHDIPCPAWSLDADPSFNDAEKTVIQEVWQRVAEDYAPFNVDVTTEFTSEAAITRSSSSDSVYGTRVLISPISGYFGPYGGIAYIGAFDDVGDSYKPALVFPENLGDSAKNIAEAATHECGHNLGLQHDGTSSVVYYGGSGSGETGWAPIMGAGYYQNLTQWSKGEYPDADNHEDDLAIVQGYLGYRADDAGDTYAAASVLPSSQTLSISGLVSSSSDVDVYRFVAGLGAATIDVKPASVGPDLDVIAEIRDANGSVVASNNPIASLSAHLALSLQQGTYYLIVRGTGKGSPLDVGGYSSYASIGQYTVSGTVAAYAAPHLTASGLPVGWTSSDVAVSLTASGGVAPVKAVYQFCATSTSQTAPCTVTVSAEGGTLLSYRGVDSLGVGEATQTAHVRIDKTAPVLTSDAVATYGGTASISASATDALSGLASMTHALDGAAPTSGSSISGVGPGNHHVVFTATDNASNTSTLTADFTVLGTTPHVTATGIPAGWTSNDVAVSLTASGGVAPVKAVYEFGSTTASQTAPCTMTVSAEGDTLLSYRGVDSLGVGETTQTAHIKIDKTAPVTTSNADTSYVSSATVAVSAVDAASGVDSIWYRVGSGAVTTYAAPVVFGTTGHYVLACGSVDNAGNRSATQTAEFTISPAQNDLPGRDRYETGVMASRSAFATESVDTVIIATGDNFPDALSGSALAGAYGGPVLLTHKDTLPAVVADEIVRLGATHAFVLGSTGVVSSAVQTQIATIVGNPVGRLWGPDRYGTAAAVAAAVKTKVAAAWDGTVFIATGTNFPDALSAGPNAYTKTRPILLVKDASIPASTTAALTALQATRAVVLGSEGLIPTTTVAAIAAKLAAPATTLRLGGPTRYDTSALVAEWIAASEGQSWSLLGIATGGNYPDALSAGPVLGQGGGVLLLTTPTSLPSPIQTTIQAHADAIQTVNFFGDDSVVSPAVRAQVMGLLP